MANTTRFAVRTVIGLALGLLPACDGDEAGEGAAEASGSGGAESDGADGADDGVDGADDGADGADDGAGGADDAADGADDGGDGADDGADGPDDGDTGAADDGVDDGDDGGEAYVCDPPVGSACNNGNSILQGRVQLSDAMLDGATTGDLHVILTHSYLGAGSTGGVLHWLETIPSVDLGAGPVEWKLDMCNGGEMWSEENCGYQLIFILDTNGNNGSTFLPDAGEPSLRYELDLGCGGPAPCLDLTLDCADGASCIQFTDPAYCSCNPSHTCGSPIAAC